VIFQDGHLKRNNVFLLGTAIDNIKYNFKNKISVIKIDVEGFEVNVLNGAKNLILEHKPVVIVEIYEKLNFSTVLQFFEDIKYKMYRKISNSEYSNQDYVFFP
jgi:hypothetical protein